MKPEIAYIYGAMHDGYIYTGKTKGKVAVITQKNRQFLENINKMIENNKGKAWIFKQRDIHVLETKLPELFTGIKPEKLSREGKVAYVSGFFDAEGGIPRYPFKSEILYIQFVQKNPKKLRELITILSEFGIECGKLHCYDKGRSNCWRFFVSWKSHRDFLNFIQSRHPEKIRRLNQFEERLFKRQTR